MSKPHAPELGATATLETFRETTSFAGDEELGASTAVSAVAVSDVVPTVEKRERSKRRWKAVAGIAILAALVVGVAVGATRSTKNENAGVAVVPEAEAPQPQQQEPVVPADAVPAEDGPTVLPEATDEAEDDARPEPEAQDPPQTPEEQGQPDQQLDDATKPTPEEEPEQMPEEPEQTLEEPEQPEGSEEQQAGDVDAVVPLEAAAETAEPTESPDAAPTDEPTKSPTPEPTSAAPTMEPTSSPIASPTAPPSEKPTSDPTSEPTNRPSPSPSEPPTTPPLDLSGWEAFNWSGETPAPSRSPSASPTPNPTDEPTSEPTGRPTSEPTNEPTNEPTPAPTTAEPTPAPTTAEPTPSPTPSPTARPTTYPTRPPRTFASIPGHDCLRSYEGMMDSMTYLAEDHPHLMTITDIGDSYIKANGAGGDHGDHNIPEGGFDIFAINVTAPDGPRTSEEKGKMMLLAGVHAREWAPPELLARFVETLVRGYGVDPDVTWILQRSEIHAILYVNPDGRYVSENNDPDLEWRKNLNPKSCGGGEDYGVDLNRNFEFMFSHGDGASDDGCDSDYHGTGPESEPETKAVADYARALFPEGQRRDDPEKQMYDSHGEENMGMFVDIHSSGGYVFYPWGVEDAVSPDDEAFQALGRKVNYFNGYKLWAGGQPDFVYPTSGESTDWAYATLGVAGMGYEIGDDWQQDCGKFEDEVVTDNLPAFIFTAKTVASPFKTIKGPDLFDLSVVQANGEIRVSAHASDGRMVNAIDDFPDFRTGAQTVAKVELYLDVHPDDYSEGDVRWDMNALDSLFDADEEHVDLVLSATDVSPGRHILYVQAADSDGYKGTISSVFVEV